jgi:CheY-like chemotaxis protein
VAGKAKKKRRSHTTKQDRDIRILHVEDNEAVTTFVRDALSDQSMHLDPCADGNAALEILKGAAPYDLLIVDNDLPGLSGLELVLRSKSMPHRRDMRIIMLSGDEIEKEAWRAGVHEFLRKPKDINRLVSAATRLVKASKHRKNTEHK